MGAGLINAGMAIEKNRKRRREEARRHIDMRKSQTLKELHGELKELKANFNYLSNIPETIAAAQTGIEDYLTFSNQNCRGLRLTNFFHGEEGRLRATKLKGTISQSLADDNLIKSIKSIKSIRVACIKSSYTKNSLQRFIYTAVTGEDVALDKNSVFFNKAQTFRQTLHRYCDLAYWITAKNSPALQKHDTVTQEFRESMGKVNNILGNLQPKIV